MKRKAIITKLDSEWEDYKKMRNETTLPLSQDKLKKYYSNKLCREKCNPKAAWKTISNLLGKMVDQLK